MVSVITNLWLSFSAGLFAPLLAVCVLPLYPGYLAYLANQLSTKKLPEQEQKKKIIMFGFIVTAGVIISMFLFGLIFTKFLQASLTKAIGIVSPFAFGILGLISILLILNIDITKLLPRIKSPIRKNPYHSSFLFGFFFGAIVLPCNPASLTILFAISTTTTSFLTNLLNFTVFGIGMAMPLLLFSIISSSRSTQVITYLSNKKRPINIIAGVIMLGISIYYLFFVFKILG